MRMLNQPAVLTGLESCIDLHANIPIESVRRLAEDTKSGFKNELLGAYECLSHNEDGELAADGKNLKLLISEIEKSGTLLEQKLGGNAALEASQLLSLGARVHFAGNFFREEARNLPHEIFFRKADFGFAHSPKQNPASLILQHKSNRFIICNGLGRRINDVKNSISALPNIVEALGKKENLSAISLPGWHVVFAGGISQKEAEFVTRNLSKLKKSGILMFTDTGGFGNLSDEDVRKLWQIYSAFDVIGMNEFEFRKLCAVNGISSKDIVQALSGLLKKTDAHTIWLHSRDFQESISKKFDKRALKNAEDNAEAAAVLHIENGGYPDAESIRRREKTGRRIKFVKSLKSQISGILNILREPSFAAQRIKYETGAGDIGAATYLWSLINAGRG